MNVEFFGGSLDGDIRDMSDNADVFVHIPEGQAWADDILHAPPSTSPITKINREVYYRVTPIRFEFIRYEE